ncbi:MAG: DUF4259 domain-containing protein [Kofleriaceae bacterium]|nr:DUF4259 domain-containing protein [Kofleriaceae bacterium]
MGAWGSGPFENDGALDFLGEGATRDTIAEVLRRCAEAAPGDYLDVDDGQMALAAAELVALGFGYGNLLAAPSQARAAARGLGPDEALRQLALRAIPNLQNPKRSELADLWGHDPGFATRLCDLLSRLTDAGPA